jgi:hypothetical protein
VTLTLDAVRHTVFGAEDGTEAAQGLLGYWGERLSPYRVPVAPHRYLAGNRNSVSSMTCAMVEPHWTDAPLDLVIGAHAVPDSDPFLSLSGSYAHRFDAEAMVFGISDRGRLAPFSALRVALAHPGLARILVVAQDQSSVPFEDPGLADLDTTADHAVALLLSTLPDATGARLELLPDACEVTPGTVGAAVDAALAGRDVDLVIAGTHVGPLTGQHVGPRVGPLASRGVIEAPGDQLCTAVWSVLADELPRGGARRIALVDYEPVLEYLCLAIVDTRGD